VLVGERDAQAAMSAFRGIAGRLVAVSSGDVYRAYGLLRGTESGPPESMPLREGAALRREMFPYRSIAKGSADWTYHYDKILAERVVTNERDLPGIVLRLPAVYGPGDDRHRLHPWLKRMDDRRPAIVLQEDFARWRWTHGYVENVAAAIAL